MKKIFIFCAIFALCLATLPINADIVLEGKTFSSTKESVSTSKDIATDYIWKDTKGIEYTIYLHQYTKGDNIGKWTAYVIKTSQKTGKEYKYYLPNGQEIADKIQSQNTAE